VLLVELGLELVELGLDFAVEDVLVKLEV